MGNMATSSRMLELLSLLQSRRDWPGSVLAGRLDISERTVRRDVERLREMGYRITAVKGPDGGYRLDAGSELPPLLFDDDQAVALAVALQSVGGAGLEEPALRALATVRQVMPSRLRNRIDAINLTAVASAPPVAVDPGTLATIGAAISARTVLRFEYEMDAATEAPLRRAEPHHLVARAARWYLVAWDLDRNDWRTFRVDRVTLRTHAGPRFEPRELPGSVTEFVEARFKGAPRNVWPCVGEVVVRLAARDIAPYIGDGTVEAEGVDSSRVRLGSWSWVGLAASIARFDAEVEVVSPPELTRAMSEIAERFGRAVTQRETLAPSRPSSRS